MLQIQMFRYKSLHNIKNIFINNNKKIHNHPKTQSTKQQRKSKDLSTQRTQ